MGVLDRAVEKYGERQLDQAQEELAELIVAISKYKRAVAKDKNIDKAVIDVIEEIADVNSANSSCAWSSCLSPYFSTALSNTPIISPPYLLIEFDYLMRIEACSYN